MNGVQEAHLSGGEDAVLTQGGQAGEGAAIERDQRLLFVQSSASWGLMLRAKGGARNRPRRDTTVLMPKKVEIGRAHV